MSNLQDDMDPEAAANRITMVERRTQKYRRLYRTGTIVLGLLTIAYFAALSVIPRESSFPYLDLMILFPIVALAIIMWMRRIGSHSREALRLENNFAGLYLVLLLAAGALEIFLFDRGTLLAALAGILPAMVCFVGAWRVRRM